MEVFDRVHNVVDELKAIVDHLDNEIGLLVKELKSLPCIKGYVEPKFIKRGNSVYGPYYYLRYDDKGVLRSIYLGKTIPENIIKSGRAKAIMREIKLKKYWRNRIIQSVERTLSFLEKLRDEIVRENICVQVN